MVVAGNVEDDPVGNGSGWVGTCVPALVEVSDGLGALMPDLRFLAFEGPLVEAVAVSDSGWLLVGQFALVMDCRTGVVEKLLLLLCCFPQDG